MDNDNKTKVVKFLKIMSAYFGLYAIHYLILPNTPIHGRYGITGYFDVSKFIMIISILLFPVFDILYLKSNLFFGFLGIVLYSICVYIYDANAVYELGYSGFFSSSYSKEWLVFILKVIVGVYVFIYIIFSFIINTIIDIREYKKNKKEKH
jgi:hypothetical protein